MYKILLGVPGSGMLTEAAAQASWLCSMRHEVNRIPCNASGPNFNNVWLAGLNAGKAGLITHLAMIHTDVQIVEDEPGLYWLDRKIEEMEATGCDFISTAISIKDHRAVTSCGVGTFDNPWGPFRRFTVEELESMPRTFSIADTQHPDKFLLHNNGLVVWDMRNPKWYETNADGTVKSVFNLTESIVWDGKAFQKRFDSEDWAYSRDLAHMGMKTCISTRITVNHQGTMSFSNKGQWGTYKNGDEDTAENWRRPCRSSLEAAEPILQPTSAN